MALVITSSNGSASYTENATAAAVDNGLIVTDTVSLSGASVTISTGYRDGDLLSFTPQPGITGTYDAGILTFSGVASASDYQALLRSVTFASSSEDPTAGGGDLTRTVTFTASDPAPSSATRGLDVTATNDAPTATADPLYSAAANQPLDLKAHNLSVADPDSGDAIVSATLSVSEGSLTVTTGGTATTVSGSGTSSVTIQGSVAAIDALLNTDSTSVVSFLDTAVNPSVGFTLTIDDLGHTGGPALSGSASSTIVVGTEPPPAPPPPSPPVAVPTVTINPDVSVYNSVVTLTGTAQAAGGLAGVELFEGTLDLGAATLNPDGSWTFDYRNGAGFHTGIAAVATDAAGQKATAPAHFDLTTGVTGAPFKTIQDNLDPATNAYLGSTYFKRFGAVYLEADYTTLPDGNSVYTYSNGTYFIPRPFSSFNDTYDPGGDLLKHVENNNDGSHTISGIADGQRLASIAFDTFTDNGSSERFVFRRGCGDETITDFQVSGPGRDTVSLPASDAGRLGQILARAYDDGAGDTTIAIGRFDTVTFLGVSKDELNAHPGVFRFHA